jgi:hypothetical protein
MRICAGVTNSAACRRTSQWRSAAPSTATPTTRDAAAADDSTRVRQAVRSRWGCARPSPMPPKVTQSPLLGTSPAWYEHKETYRRRGCHDHHWQTTPPPPPPEAHASAYCTTLSTTKPTCSPRQLHARARLSPPGRTFNRYGSVSPAARARFMEAKLNIYSGTTNGSAVNANV